MPEAPRTPWWRHALDVMAGFGGCSGRALFFLALVILMLVGFTVTGVLPLAITAFGITFCPIALVVALVLGLLTAVPPLRAAAAAGGGAVRH